MSGLVHEAPVSLSVEWYTPRWIFEALKVKFDLDPCHPYPAIDWVPCAQSFNIHDDGLGSPWPPGAFVWMNPPYGDPEHPCKKNCTKKRCIKRGHHNELYRPGMIDWMKKMAEHNNGIALVFARTDTEWFHKYVSNAATAVLFLEGRVKFVDCNHNEAGTPGCGSMLVAYGEKAALTLATSDVRGCYVRLKR